MKLTYLTASCLSLAITADALLVREKNAIVGGLRVPDAHCSTGSVSSPLVSSGNARVCCPSYCGECSDYATCASVRGQNSTNACCATKVYELQCGSGAPANVCLHTCDKSYPPCIMQVETYVPPNPDARSAVTDCNEAVADWRSKAEAALAGGEGGGGAAAAGQACPSKTLEIPITGEWWIAAVAYKAEDKAEACKETILELHHPATGTDADQVGNLRGRTYFEKKEMAIGTQACLDRDIRFETVPDELLGTTVFVGGSCKYMAPGTMTLTTNVPGTVYIWGREGLAGGTEKLGWDPSGSLQAAFKCPIFSKTIQ